MSVQLWQPHPLCFVFSLLACTLVLPTLIPLEQCEAFSMMTKPPQRHYIGVDLGTSGARLSIIQQSTPTSDKRQFEEIFTATVSWNEYIGCFDDPTAWMKAVKSLLQQSSDAMSLENVHSICISGTSASCLLVEKSSDTDSVVKMARISTRMYNYNVTNVKVMEILNDFAPPKHTVRSPTSSLAKLLAWNAEKPLTGSERLCHQADYVIRQFLKNDDDTESDITIFSDWHNCLKLGYDVRNLVWPDWLTRCLESVGVTSVLALPHPVVSPGQPLGTIASWAIKSFGIPDTCILTGGTTDSNAAFFAAAGIDGEAGTAVTSLGSTLAIKQLSKSYVEDATRGVYSHRFPKSFSGSSSELWLVGGASNVGCAVLRDQGFSDKELDDLSISIDATHDSPLAYYPLSKKGERFPIADSDKEPILKPIPDSRAEYLKSILQGISGVERDGYLALGELGVSPSYPVMVFSCGGGSSNDMWTQMRQRRLQEVFPTKIISVQRAVNIEASFGAAILAAASFINARES